jgi:CheY-like chemotaxis protein
VLQSVVELLQPVLHSAGIELRTGDLSSGVFASIHPVGLRQLLVRCLTAWSRQYRPSATPCWIEGEVAAATNAVTIRLTGADADLDPLAADALVQELLKTYGGALHLQQDRAGVTLTITLPTAPAIHVLVVDDNEDLLHFYRRYLRDTRYQITALSDGRDLYETVEAVRPDVIILDVMLPGIDGWNLLTNLRQHPLGSTLPIIVCSVIQEEALALALGATGYLAKPVRRSALIEALNAAIRPSSAVAAA